MAGQLGSNRNDSEPQRSLGQDSVSRQGRAMDKGHIMSFLEQTIWTVLGYGVMPFIFLSGFVAVAVTCCVLLNAFGVQSAEK